MQRKKVFFTAKKKMLNGKPQQYCQCDGCFDVTSVSVLRIPVTRFYDKKNLTTHYKEYWYCDVCLAKLERALRKNNEVTL